MHTPGPWKLEIQSNQFSESGYIADICANYDGAEGDTIARLTTAFAPSGRSITREEVLANGTLMAAAPALAATLDEALTWWHSDSRNFERQEPAWLEKARKSRAAIKDAG